MGKAKPPPPERPATPFHNPFRGLADRLGVTPAPPTAASRGDAATPRGAPASGAAPAVDAAPAGGGSPPGDAVPASGEPGPTGAARPRPAPARAVIRIERKGRGGKEATVVEKLDVTAGELERWSLELKRSLGCGGGVEGGAIVLHGDQRARAKAWLEARGVRKVTLG
jgi:translation initiation factor 1